MSPSTRQQVARTARRCAGCGEPTGPLDTAVIGPDGSVACHGCADAADPQPAGEVAR